MVKEKRAPHRTFPNGTDDRSHIPLTINSSGSRIRERKGLLARNPPNRGQ